MKTFYIEGKNVVSIPSFYIEINRLLMQNETWQLGESLDALNDVLYSGFSAIANHKKILFIWNNSQISRVNLGLQTTRTYLETKLNNTMYNKKLIQKQLDELVQGTGSTYF
ncbi:ribonuclease inhibitor [Flavobacterium agricola]|uniref:Ribonuclease inhibitor n=1 Tax=Flavobacterium agricola TaxID=2870839 RepID=A0ABY6LYG9_9FLAO|nr:ribonuclease inhibitor [Flavobacterium agricola]UYW01385.1 ribonuclease inhibitor [Flavobacterium agricola]